MSAVTKKSKPLYKKGDLLYKESPSGSGKFVSFKVREIKFNDFWREYYYYSSDCHVDGAFEGMVSGLVPKIPHNPKAPKSGRLMR